MVGLGTERNAQWDFIFIHTLEFSIARKGIESNISKSKVKEL
jgi:hypothetical protein